MIFNFSFLFPQNSVVEDSGEEFVSDSVAQMTIEKAMYQIKEFFFSCWKYELSGVKDFPDVEKYCGLPNYIARLMTFPVWNEEGKPGQIYEYFYPQYEGYFQSIENYDPAQDDGSWVKTMIFTSENNFTISVPVELEEGEQLIKENLDDGSEIPSLVPPEERTESVAVRQLRNSNQVLRLFSYDKEQFVLEKNENSYVTINKYDKKLVRKFFDESLKLQKRETWKIGTSIDSSSLEISEDFTYNAEGKLSNSLVKNKNEYHKLDYDKNGLVTRSLNYKVEEEKKEILSLSTWNYDDKKRITQRSVTEYEYVNGKRFVKDSKKEEFSYKIEDGNPDYSYFENNELKLKTVYSALDDYITTMYFDGGFVIESYYKQNNKQKDLIFLNGELRRTRVYEKK